MARAKEKFAKPTGGTATATKPPTKKDADDLRARRKAEREQREAERREKAEAKEAEEDAARQKEIDEGAVVLTEDGEEFKLVTVSEDANRHIDKRAEGVIASLQEANGTPLLGKELQAEYGGGYPLYIPIFSTLKALGLVTEYRRRTGERGGGGKAYIWIGPKE